MSNRCKVILLCVLIIAGVPVAAHAQGVGGLLRKKAAQVAGTNGNEPASEADASVYGEDVLELTEPVMKGFMNGLRVEIAGLEEFASLIETYRKPEEWERCRGEALMSAEGMDIAGRLANLPDNASPEELQRAVAKANEEMIALTKRACGPDVRDDWPQDRRKERVAAIVTAAAAAAGPVGLPVPEPMPATGPVVPDAFDLAGTYAAGFVEAVRDSMTLRQYGITQERAENYCRLLRDGVIQPGQAVKYPAPGGKVFWVYKHYEATAIEPECPELLDAMDARNALLARTYLFGKQFD